jgi:hypothetical protein
VQHAHGQFGFVFVDQHRNLDLAGRDRLNVDAAVGQRPEHRGGNACVAFHADANDRDLGDFGVGDDAVEADRFLLRLPAGLRAQQIGAGHGEGHVGLALVAANVLDDHVDVDVRCRERAEDRGDRAGPVGHAGQDHFGFVLVGGDAGDELAFHIQSFEFFVADDHRAGDVIGGGRIVADEAGEHLHPHALFHRQPDRAGLQHFRADRGQFEHFFVGHVLQLARLGDDPRVGSIDTIDVGVDIAAIRADRRCHRHRRRIGTAAAQRGDPIVVTQPLEPRDHRNLARRHAGQQCFAVD